MSAANVTQAGLQVFRGPDGRDTAHFWNRSLEKKKKRERKLLHNGCILMVRRLADDTLGKIPSRAGLIDSLPLEAARLLAVQILLPASFFSPSLQPFLTSQHLPNGKHVAGLVIC